LPCDYQTTLFLTHSKYFCKESNQRPDSHSKHSSSKRANYGTGIPQDRESTRHRANNNNYGSERKLRVSFLKPKVILKGLLGSTVEAKDEAWTNNLYVSGNNSKDLIYIALANVCGLALFKS
jgi:hypothetical protein